MDEILSSIRQIIADEDMQAVGGNAVEPTAQPEVPEFDAGADEDIPLSLSTDQMLSGAMSEQAESLDEEPLVLSTPEPEFEPDTAISDEDLGEPEMSTGQDTAPVESEMGFPPIVVADDVAFEEDAAADDEMQADEDEAPAMPPVREPFVEDIPVAASAMPDPGLSAAMTEELLAPATNAAVRSTMSRLNSRAAVASGVTLDDMVREMMRPMIKAWLDENLPAMVERLVEREISRISRGE